MTDSLWTVHYTHEQPWSIRPIQIENLWVKPKGGIYASPMNCKESWAAWCRTENFGLSPHKVYLLVDISKAITIDQVSDLGKLAWTKLPRSWGLQEIPDYETMRDSGVEVIYLTAAGQWATRFADIDSGMVLGHNLYGWDCECLLIMSERAILKVQKSRPRVKRKQAIA